MAVSFFVFFFLLIGSEVRNNLCHHVGDASPVCYNLVDVVSTSIVGFQSYVFGGAVHLGGVLKAGVLELRSSPSALQGKTGLGVFS